MSKYHNLVFCFIVLMSVFAVSQVDYNSEIQPIFNSSCTNCHVYGHNSGLSLESYDWLMNGGNSGPVVVPFNHAASILWQMVESGSMPPGNNPDLSDAQINLIAQWIDEGALEFPQTDVLYVNEIDYDQPSTDSEEFLEIAGPAGTYSNVVVELVNGNSGSIYDTIDLGSITLSDENQGYGYFVVGSENVANVDLVEFTTNGIQNGAPDGIQLRVNGIIVNAVSYEGAMNDTDGNPMEVAIETSNPESGEGKSIGRIGLEESEWSVLDSSPGEINTYTEPEEIPISDIQYNTTNQGDGTDCYPSPYDGDGVIVTGVVSGVKPGSYPNFYIQDPEATEWGGVYVYDTSVNPIEGDEITLTALVEEYNGFTELLSVTNFQILSTGNGITPLDITTDQLSGGCSATGEPLEGMLVRISDVTVVAEANEFGEWYVEDASGLPCQIDGGMFDPMDDFPNPSMSAFFSSIVGVVDYAFSEFGINPRYMDDILQTTSGPVISNVTWTPALVFNGTEIEIYSDVTDPDGAGDIASVELQYGTGGILNQSTEMELDEGYVGYITPDVGNVMLQFKVVATDQAGETSESSLFDIPVGSMTETVSIYDIQTNSSSYVGSVVTVAGVVTIGSGVTDDSNTRAYIQDQSGRGLNLFAYGLLDPSINRGDSLLVVGIVDQYYTTTEIVDFNYILESIGNEIPDPAALTVSGSMSEDWEGTLLHVSGGELGEIIEQTGVFNVPYFSGTDTLFVRVYEETGITQDDFDMQEEYSFIGVGSMYSDDYQLILGYQEDIITGSGMFDFATGLSVSDNLGGVINLSFGSSPFATDGFDEGMDNYHPPFPPEGFDAALSQEGDLYYDDFRPTIVEEIVWNISVQWDSGASSVTFSWDPNSLYDQGSFILEDVFGMFVSANMKVENSLTVDNSALTSFTITHRLTIEMAMANLAGWNMIGLPLTVEDASYQTLFPNAINGTLYLYNGAYQSASELAEGGGYWLRFSDAGSNTITGYDFSSISLALTEGWNMIAGPSYVVNNIDDPGNIIIGGTTYGYNGAYYNSSTIDPGLGYWIRANAAGTITLDASARARISSMAGTPLNSNVITFTNSVGFSNDLYAGVPHDEDVNLSNSLPPVPPSGGFDVRFEGDLKVTDAGGQILVQNSQWPLVVSLAQGEWDRKLPSNEWVLVDEMTGVEYGLSETGTVKISEPTERLTLYRSTGTPEHFSLSQNYPNPFNPITTIRFDLPEESDVTLTVYDLLGQEIVELVSDRMMGGAHTVKWDASANASGIYICKLTSEKQLVARKMVLLK
tara:strand:- start:7003 stop:10869 length:3867 start_codon:yes stop_codon:yes gene_type:complete